MSARTRNSKRLKRVPNKFEDTICDLNKKKETINVVIDNQDEIRVDSEKSGEIGDNGGVIDAVEDVEEIRAESGEMNGSESSDADQTDAEHGQCWDQVIDKVFAECDDGVRMGMEFEAELHNVHTDNDIPNVSTPEPIKQSVAKSTPAKGTYAFMASSNAALDKTLDFVPTLNENGNEFVIFDEELVSNESLKWNLNICGHFVGMKMSYNELRYNLVRMWGKHGLGEMFSNDNGVFCFKFKNEEGMNFVLDNSPWMVNNRPFFVQKWSPDVSLDKPERDKIPLWVKMMDIPLEAWNKEGISKLASSVGKPLVMDEMTANMCQYGKGRIGYARVLVEVDAKKTAQGVNRIRKKQNQQNQVPRKGQATDIGKAKFVNNYAGMKRNPTTKKFAYRPKSNQNQASQMGNNVDVQRSNIQSKNNENGSKIGERRKSNTNMYALLADCNEDGNGSVLNQDQKKEVDFFVFQKIQPTPSETSKWSHLMVNYFKDRWEKCNDMGYASNEEEDVIDGINEARIIDNEIECMEGGMGTVDKQDEIQKLILENKISIFAILETRAKDNEADRICSKIFNRWNWCTNMPKCSKGCRIALGWNSRVVNVNVIFYSWQVMFCLVESIQDKTKFFCSFVYAANHGKERKDLWKDLSHQNQIVNGRPWMILGDFNVTLHSHEHSAGSSIINQDMQDFKDCVDSNELSDLCSSGFQFTWTKSPSNPSNADKPDFLATMGKDWKSNMEGFQMFKVVKALKNIKKSMNRLNWKNGNLFEKVIQLRDNLGDPFDAKVKKEEAKTLLEYKEAKIDENNLLKQKFKIDWLKEGDKNTAYFHKVMKGRKHLSRIESICDEDGKRFYGDDVPNQFVRHFHLFLGVERHVKTAVGIGRLIINKLSPEEASNMIHPVSDEEIKQAMFDIDNDKAPGPDGFTSYFFKKTWSIVGQDTCEAIKEFFNTGKLLKEVNATLISLIPKVNTSNKVYDCRPIACCNVLYKCISKILTNRIKSGLDKVVSMNQSAFIPGRSIHDNILLTQELLKGYKRKNWPKRCALKIDLQKAYDTIQGYFKGARGLRQGDPISPYLFTLVMEILNLIMIRNIEDKGNFKSHAGCKELKITHLCFADDLMVFCHGDVHSIFIVKQSLDEFSSFSGLLPNLKKSTAFFGSIRDKDKIDLLKIIPFSTGVLPMKYLGVPLLARCIGVNDCNGLIEKIKTRIGDWKNRFLSYAGRVQLIAFVLASMQTYWASVYLIPNTVVKEINKVMKKFLWDNKGNNSGRAKVAWKVVCRPKDQGGLVIKPLGEWNETLLLKNIWKIVVQSQTLWVKWVNRVKLKGRTTSVWYDKWSLSGPLSNFINKRDIYDARLKDNSCVADMIKDGSWIWPNDWYDKFPILKSIIVPIINHNQDQIVWMNNKDNKQSLKSEMFGWMSEYNMRKCLGTKLFGSLNVPLDIHLSCGLLFTKDCRHRMLLQNGEMIWDSIKGKIMMHNAPCIWEEIIEKLNMMHSKNNIKSIISKIGVAACVYAIWKERNIRIFQGKERSDAVIVKEISEDIKWKLASLTVKKSKAIAKVYNDWDIKPNYAT
ncbi:probable L-cysteine desulfhydrase, chloroplastic [Tanacetum coccineum]